MFVFVLLSLLAALVFAEEGDTGCTDVDNIVTCCLDLEISFIELDGCAELIIDWEMLDVEFEFFLNGVLLFDDTFGFDEPPLFCTDIWGLSICLGIEDLLYDDWVLSGCLDLVIEGAVVEIGCFSAGDGE
eukprot:gnl/Chilomastix_cuspidata/47.p2 GENE.gnl/Chilomastix_cuspidata/47~~gnl/Chilomastix_cuspidata/47.p2  ORF type:complete len:130 (+),score=26.23 gnl/Chilomastix_cuspidata/47:37-426(+)